MVVATDVLPNEGESARDLVRRKLRSLERFDRPTQARRLTGMLARKGYPSSVVFSVVRDELGGAEELADGQG